MGMALDEPKANDEKIEAGGFSFVASGDVAEIIRSYGSLSIDYVEGFLKKGFQLSFAGQGSCS